MYELRVSESFNAAHQLNGYNGDCARLHGHTWTVTLQVSGDTLDNVGMLVDFKRVKSRLRTILADFDHQYLNDLAPFAAKNPTAENLARHIYESCRDGLRGEAAELRVDFVRVYESPSTVVTYHE